MDVKPVPRYRQKAGSERGEAPQKTACTSEEIEAYLLKHGLPKPMMSNGDIVWVTPPEFVPDSTDPPKPESDRMDHFAITADFTNQQPTADVLERRLKYRERLWVNCLPPDQRFALMTFYGPIEQGYDIDSPKVGFEMWGMYADMPEVYRKVAEIRKRNPHAVSFPLRCLDLGTGKRVDLPPPNDGSTRTSHINRFHQQIMNRHFQKTVQEFKQSEQRTEQAMEELQQRNDAVDKYSDKLLQHAQRLLKMSPTEIQTKRESCRERLFSCLPQLSFADASVSRPTDPSGKNIIQQLTAAAEADVSNPEVNSDSKDANGADSRTASMPSLTYDQVDDYIKNQTDLTNLPPGYKSVYRLFTEPQTGRVYLVRSIQFLEAEEEKRDAMPCLSD